MTLRRAIAAPRARSRAESVGCEHARGRSYSRLFAVGERSGWSVDEDARHLEATARRLGYDGGADVLGRTHAKHQAVFLTSHFEALQPRWLESSHRLGTAYLHGRPGTPGYPEFDVAFETLRRQCASVRTDPGHPRRDVRARRLRGRRACARVPHSHRNRSRELRSRRHAAARGGAKLRSIFRWTAFVVGSFQKDGVGWGEGLEPKLIKGPDVLVAALEQVHAEAPGLVVLLTGPARGYVRQELDRLGIPYRHVLTRHSSRACARVSRARCVCRLLTTGGWAKGSARGDGRRSAPRHDSRGAGAGVGRRRAQRSARGGRRCCGHRAGRSSLCCRSDDG